MSAAFDFVIRNGLVVDGSGTAPFEGDVGISDGKIAVIGDKLGSGSEEIDAKGMIVTPGFVDIHTHYDGQITWEDRLQPSSNHGVTSVVMGNCGVGFAPCKPEHRDDLVRVMEGVEDVPEVVMTEGIPWTWETFPEYLAVLRNRRADIDFAAQIPHAAVRVDVMGDRGVHRDPPTDLDLNRMTAIVAEGIRAGALGVSTTRNIHHRTVAGDLAPPVNSMEAELHALAKGLAEAGTGVFQLVGRTEEHDPEEEVALFRRLTRTSGRPLSYSLLQFPVMPDGWQRYLDATSRINADGGPPIRGQIFPRPLGLLYGLELSFHPFKFNPSFRAIDHLPLPQKIEAMRDPELRRRILAEEPEHSNPTFLMFARDTANLYPMNEVPDYEPSADDSVDAIAARHGVPPREFVYDLMVETEGRIIFFSPSANFSHQTLDPVFAMMSHPNTLVGLGDGGAHYGMICDASFPTTLLSYWARDRQKGSRLLIEQAVRLLTRPNALAVGLNDRGLIAPGMKADINVIDFEHLQLHRPGIRYDLPAGGRRLTQEAEGYQMTMVGGQVTYREGQHTGALPGRLVSQRQ